MKSLLRRYSLLIALLVYWIPPAYSQTPTRVDKIEIKHVGPQAVSDDLIRSHIRVRVGDNYMRTAVDEDVRTLYGTGYFHNIRVVEDLAATGIKLSYVVQGKPVLTDIKFEGNKKFSTSKLQKKLTAKVGEPLDERKLFTDAQELTNLYQKSGYQKTKVKYNMKINESAGRGSVVFEVEEAPKVKIAAVDFVGAEAFPQKQLQKVLKTRKRGMWSWLTGTGVLKEDEFEDDKERLAEFYHNLGYIDFELKDVKFEELTPNQMAIRLAVNEGKKYKVGDLSFKGNTLFNNDELRKELKLVPGTVLSPKTLNEDLEKLRDKYGDKGYIDAHVIAEKKANTETGNIDLVHQIDEKDKSFIEKIEIRGNTKTKDKVIRRELAVAPGETYNNVKVKLSKYRLQGLNFFEKVETQPEPTDVPNRKNLIVNVEEKNTGNMTVGAGFSSIDSLIGFVEVSQANFDLFKPWNFTGAGQKFRARASFGTERQDYVISFIEPWFLERKLQFGVDLYHRNMAFQSALYEQRQTGARVSLSRTLGSDFLIGGVNYTVESIGINNVTASASPQLKGEAGDQLVSKIGTSIAYDTRGGGFLPNKGQKTELTAEVAGGPLGGDAAFYKLELRTGWYFKGLAEGHVLELTGRSGFGSPWENGKNVPLFYRYFLGGANTLRGYRYPQVGPRDSLNEPFGGNTYYMGTAEYSIPVIDRVRLAAFYDIGNVFSQPFSFNPGVGETIYQDDVGIGIRLNIPNLGPLRLDYARPLKTDSKTSRSGRIQFSVGYTREF